MAISSGGQTIYLLVACALLLCNVLFSINHNCSVSTTNGDESELMTYNPPPTLAVQSSQTAELIIQPTLPLHNQTFTIGICAIMKDMDAYLNEWLDYHLVAMGIDKIYLYDNSLEFYLKNWYENTREHPVYKHYMLFIGKRTLSFKDDHKRHL